MNFDRLAPHYRWIEAIFAGEKLQRCRTAFLADLPAPGRVLLVGEGNGRFLAALRERFPEAHLTYVDASAVMLATARNRLRTCGLKEDEIEWVQADLLEWTPPARSFDLLVTHFLLDCFRVEQLAAIVPRLAAATRPGATWLLADFREPASGLARWGARGILALLYGFFRLTTRLPASHLTPPDPFLLQSGFALRERRIFEWGLLHSDRWEKLEEAEK